MNTSSHRAKRISLNVLRDAGKAVVVTGASGGIGLAVANRLHDDGWHVVATDLDLARLRSVFSERVDDARMQLAALDVTDPEPPPPGHPLWSAPGVLISPHSGGASSAMWPRARRLVRQQLERFAAGEQLANVMKGDY